MNWENILDWFTVSDGIRNVVQVLAAIAGFFVAFLGGRIVQWYQFKHKAFPDQIMINLNTVEMLGDKPVLIPRTALAETPIQQVVRDPLVAGWIVKKAKNLSSSEKNVYLDDPKDHALMMKQIRNRVSELAVEGHILRMAKKPHDVTRCWCALTYESYGSNDGGHAIRMLRIQVISQDDLKLFARRDLVEKLEFIDGEGSHSEEAALLRKLALEEYQGAKSEDMVPGTYKTKSHSPNLRYVALPTAPNGTGK